MPRYPIDRATNFIVENESWTVVEYDHTSVPGVIYLSLTEGKINVIYDDLENNIADTDKLAQYELSVPIEVQSFSLGDIIAPSFTLMKNGLPYDAEVELIPTDKKCARIIDGKLTAVGAGTTTIIVQLKECPTISKTLEINIGEEQTSFSGYIDGPDSIRLDREATYTLKGTSDVAAVVTFKLDSVYASIIKIEDNKCTVRANANNKLGICTLTAIYEDIEYSKTISIVPLW